MKATYKVSDNLTLDVEVKDTKQAFQFAATCDTVFGTKRCGNCESPNLLRKYKKTPEGYEYYSVECQSCQHEFKFGQAKEGGQLFPKGWSPPYNRDNAAPFESRNEGDPDEYRNAYRNERAEAPSTRREPATSGVGF